MESQCKASDRILGRDRVCLWQSAVKSRITSTNDAYEPRKCFQFRALGVVPEPYSFNPRQRGLKKGHASVVNPSISGGATKERLCRRSPLIRCVRSTAPAQRSCASPGEFSAVSSSTTRYLCTGAFVCPRTRPRWQLNQCRALMPSVHGM